MNNLDKIKKLVDKDIVKGVENPYLKTKSRISRFKDFVKNL